jgi:threonine dehydrogenase-like Zn-dependent dehydrogenase
MPRELIATAPGETAYREYEEPSLGEHEVRVRTEFAAPKHGTESHGFLAESLSVTRTFDPEYRIFLPAEEEADAFPRRLGNMCVGVVTEVGPAARRFGVGDRVYGHLPIRETHTIGEEGRFAGTPPLGSGVREGRFHHVPEGMTPIQVVCLDPSHFALAAIRDANIRLGERVAVFGLGAIGLMIVQMARLSGASVVYALDPLANRRELAVKLGADEVFDPSNCDAGYEIKRATGKAGVDVAIDASGAYAALQDAIRAVHYSGLVVTVSFYHGAGSALRLGEEWHLTRVTVRSSMPVWGNPSRDYPMWDDERVEDTAFELMRQGRLATNGLIDPIVSFEEAAEAYQMVHSHPERCVKLGITFP